MARCPADDPYAANRVRTGVSRLVVELPEELLVTVDRWGAGMGFPSRTSTVQHLLKAGMRAQRALEAAE